MKLSDCCGVPVCTLPRGEFVCSCCGEACGVVEDRKGLVYLATPYSHPDPAIREHRFREVNRVAGEMMRSGVFVFSPISHTHPIALAVDLPKGWEFWSAYDLTILRACCKVVVLMQDGWRESVGVRAEIALARRLGLPVEFMEHEADRPPTERRTAAAGRG